jgi:hypothetical protein
MMDISMSGGGNIHTAAPRAFGSFLKPHHAPNPSANAIPITTRDINPDLSFDLSLTSCVEDDVDARDAAPISTHDYLSALSRDRGIAPSDSNPPGEPNLLVR